MKNSWIANTVWCWRSLANIAGPWGGKADECTSECNYWKVSQESLTAWAVKWAVPQFVVEGWEGAFWVTLVTRVGENRWRGRFVTLETRRARWHDSRCKEWKWKEDRQISRVNKWQVKSVFNWGKKRWEGHNAGIRGINMVALFLQQHYCGELGGKVQFQQFERRKSNRKLPLLQHMKLIQ